MTGARLSQAARLTCGDLQADRPDPRLMMPSSFKGAQKKITHRPVPITPALAAALKKATSDRPGEAPLLLKRDGSAWQATNTSDHRDLFRRAVERAGLDPDQITSYALRHSSVVRALLAWCSRRCCSSTARYQCARDRSPLRQVHSGFFGRDLAPRPPRHGEPGWGR